MQRGSGHVRLLGGYGRNDQCPIAHAFTNDRARRIYDGMTALIEEIVASYFFDSLPQPIRYLTRDHSRILGTMILRTVAIRLHVLSWAFWAFLMTGSAALAQSGQFFKASDRADLHYLSAGQGSRTIVFIPGWLMPADVFRHQLVGLSHQYRVVLLDPRGQGKSTAQARDMSAARRADDLRDLVQQLKLNDFVLVGWSLGVMEILELMTRHRLPGLKGLVLVDNSIGMGPPPQARLGRRSARPMQPEPFRQYVSEFSRAIFKRPPENSLLEIVERSASQLEPKVAWGLLDKPHNRDYYRQAVLASSVPLWYAITPRYRTQAEELVQLRPMTSVTIFEDAGHALFVDSAEQFNAELVDFLARLE